MSTEYSDLICVLTGAGISAESGIETFRGAGGLWNGHDVMEVASPEGFAKDPALVIDFYNQRRKQLAEVEPNAGHYALVKLQEYFNVIVVTQNVDDLHERAGSNQVLHLHGELRKVKSVLDPSYVKDIEYGEIQIGDTCPKGGQLRPDVVWFGEPVPAFDVANKIAEECAAFIVVGTSLAVYPAASLMYFAPNDIPQFLVDPNPAMDHVRQLRNMKVYKENASTGLPKLVDELIGKYT